MVALVPSDEMKNGLFHVCGKDFKTINEAVSHAGWEQRFNHKHYSIPIYQNGELVRLKRF